MKLLSFGLLSSLVLGEERISLKGKEAQALLKNLIKEGQAIRPSETCLIGAGYNTCEDYNFRAVDLFKALEGKMEHERTLNGEFVP